MGNLGRYQEITTRASQLGGVDELIASIEKSAVLRAAPKQVGIGVVGALGAIGLVYTSAKVYRWRQELRAERIESGEQARNEVAERLSVDEAIVSDGGEGQELTGEGE